MAASCTSHPFVSTIRSKLLAPITTFDAAVGEALILAKKIGYAVCLQMNDAVSKVNKKFISRLTRAKPTPLAAATVQVSHALPGVR